jgi:hypothetical protein
MDAPFAVEGWAYALNESIAQDMGGPYETDLMDSPLLRMSFLKLLMVSEPCGGQYYVCVT